MSGPGGCQPLISGGGVSGPRGVSASGPRGVCILTYNGANTPPLGTERHL